jgi:hypothetical protein
MGAVFPTVCAGFLFLTLGVLGAQAYPSAHGPYAPGTAPKHGKLVVCELVSATSTDDGDAVRIYGVPGPKDAPRLRQEVVNDTRITVLDPAGAPLSETYRSEYRCIADAVYSADFNRDGEADFFTVVCNMGNGLAARLTESVFFLSHGGRYTAVPFGGYDGGPEDVLRMRKGGPWYYISTALVSSHGLEPAKPHHNYWLYRLYRFEGHRVMETTEISRFPKFVWYTEKENHQETMRLTVDEKAQLLEKVRLEEAVNEEGVDRE